MMNDLSVRAPTEQNHQCRICGNAGMYATYSIKEMMFGSREAFDYFVCSNCSCLQIARVPEDLSRHYPSHYYSQVVRNESAPMHWIKQRVAHWYCVSAVTRPNSAWRRIVRQLLPEPGAFAEFGEYLAHSTLKSSEERILDVGCGASPYRLTAFQRCGFQNVEGIDPFISADLIYNGVPVRKATIDQCTGTYGMVMFHHSLEHVPDPHAALATAARLLRQGGTCLVRIPVFGTYFWRRFGTNWVELDAPRHLYLMAPETVGWLANETGFRIRYCYYDSAPWEIAGSLRYERGLSLRDDITSSASPFTREELDRLKPQVDQLNKLCTGGRACFYLERI